MDLLLQNGVTVVLHDKRVRKFEEKKITQRDKRGLWVHYLCEGFEREHPLLLKKTLSLRLLPRMSCSQNRIPSANLERIISTVFPRSQNNTRSHLSIRKSRSSIHSEVKRILYSSETGNESNAKNTVASKNSKNSLVNTES